MSQNIHEIFIANPAVSLANNDLFYLGRSPYAASDDYATQWSTILSYIPGSVVVTVTGTSATLGANQITIADNLSLVSLALPTTVSKGAIIEVVGQGEGGWRITQSAGQQIIVGNVLSTLGAGGRVGSQNRYDTIRLLCVTANTVFQMLSGLSLGYDIV